MLLAGWLLGLIVGNRNWNAERIFTLRPSYPLLLLLLLLHAPPPPYPSSLLHKSRRKEGVCFIVLDIMILKGNGNLSSFFFFLLLFKMCIILCMHRIYFKFIKIFGVLLVWLIGFHFHILPFYWISNNRTRNIMYDFPRIYFCLFYFFCALWYLHWNFRLLYLHFMWLFFFIPRIQIFLNLQMLSNSDLWKFLKKKRNIKKKY